MTTGLKMQAASGVGEIWLYDVIGEGWFGGGITGAQFVRQLQQLGDVRQITLHVNSPGGSVYDGTAIYNALKNHPAQVTVDVEGAALSAASLVAMAGDTIRMAKNAMLMIHDPANIVFGTAANLRKEADTLQKHADSSAQTYADRSGQPLEQVRAAMQAETWYSAEEAQAAGFVDEVVANKQKPGAAGPAQLATANAALLQKFQKRPANWSMAMLSLPADPPADPETESVMDLKELKEKHPGLVAQIEKDASEKTLNDLASKDDAAKRQSEIEMAARKATAAEAKRQSDIRAMCAQAKCHDQADTLCADTSLTVADAQARLFAQMCKNNPPPTQGAGDPGESKDPDAAYKKEFAEQRTTLLQMGISEEQYLRTRRRDDGKEPLTPQK